MKTKIIRTSRAPWDSNWKADSLLIYDRYLLKVPGFRGWLKRFPASYGVKAGEELKDISAFPGHLSRISRLTSEMASRRMTILVAGGGSVGDFGGFVASIYKRGVRLVHLPTTWLAAIDSSHGGKTALNVEGAKNQIGTFYPASEVYLVKPFLMAQPPERAVEATGEALKMMILKGSAFFPPRIFTKDPSEALWTALPKLIQGKMSIVEKDPTETSGFRHLLNLGHTMGHVFEAELKMPHGLSVTYGLIFALIYSRSRRDCSEKDLAAIFSHPAWRMFLPSALHLRSLSIPPSRIRTLLLKDKKRTSRQLLRFIFVRKMGKPFIREIGVDEILDEVARQKRLLKVVYG
ncbi:MAG: hypothetical protein KF789_07810 [Bdellovibrionaceae bacterium]|nr:hypothetical protein [Pseudobdellovibrionaceae bacterium]